MHACVCVCVCVCVCIVGRGDYIEYKTKGATTITRAHCCAADGVDGDDRSPFQMLYDAMGGIGKGGCHGVPDCNPPTLSPHISAPGCLTSG
jgi:hypothetical protein